MRYFYIVKDGKIEARCVTKENALSTVKMYQELEKKAHQWLHAEFSIIEGNEEEFIKY